MVRITYVGHATVEVETLETRLLTDPVLRERVAHLRRLVPLGDPRRFTQPDAVLVSHAHFDHLDVASLRLLSECRVLAPRGCRGTLRRAGLTDVTEVGAGEAVELGPVKVTATRMDHDGRRHPASRARESLGYLIDGGARILFAGDTGLFEGMRELAGGIDVALLPIWGWGGRLGRGHMDPVQAARAASLLRPRIAIPIHWGTLGSPRAGWLADPDRPAREFARHVAEVAPTVDVRVLPPGGVTEIR